MTTTPKEQTARLAETIAYLNRWLAERGYIIVASDRLAALDALEAVVRDHLAEASDPVRLALSRSEAAEKGARG